MQSVSEVCREVPQRQANEEVASGSYGLPESASPTGCNTQGAASAPCLWASDPHVWYVPLPVHEVLPSRCNSLMAARMCIWRASPSALPMISAW